MPDHIYQDTLHPSISGHNPSSPQSIIIVAFVDKPTTILRRPISSTPKLPPWTASKTSASPATSSAPKAHTAHKPAALLSSRRHRPHPPHPLHLLSSSPATLSHQPTASRPKIRRDSRSSRRRLSHHHHHGLHCHRQPARLPQGLASPSRLVRSSRTTSALSTRPALPSVDQA